MDFIKEAFQKVKKDIDFLGNEINFLRLNLIETREKMVEICEIITQINKKIDHFDKNNSINNPTHKTQIPTISIHSSTDNLPLKALNNQNIPISIGNEGASTDRQTDRQTDRKEENNPKIEENNYKSRENSIDDAVEILNSLDNIKKEIRLKFKKLTNQELLIFSTIYQLDEERGYSDYQTLAKKLNLTESSIRDYVGRIIKKGISIDKNKINNKNIQLSIPQNLKKIATLSTILQLRDL